nr:hypothetical protein [Tanacetum cinerariifolium]
MIVDSIENGPYVRQMIATPREPDLPILVLESLHEQTDGELTETDIKRMDADDQAIQTILVGLPEDIYAAVDSCEIAKEIWERVRQMMEGSDIGNLKRNEHFPENIASNLKFLNNLQPEWKRHVTIVRQTKNRHEADFTQIYDFLKMNQEENGGIQGAQNAGVQRGGNQNRLVVVLGIANQSGTDSCETAKEIWEHVRQMMNGSDIGEQEKKAKLFNEWEKFTSTDGESIESYYHRFMQLMNDLKRNKHFSENIASNLKFLNNLQPEWKRHVTIVRQTKNLHEADFTQIYDFLKMNQEEVNKIRAERLAKSHVPLALMAHSQNSFNFPTTYKDQSSSSTHPQQSFPINNKYNPQPPLNQNFMQPPMTSLEDINDPTETMNATLILFAKEIQLFAPTNNNQRTSSNPRNRQIAQPVMNIGQDRQIQNVRGNGGNQFGQYAGQVAQNQQRNCTARPRRRDAAYLQTQLLIAQKEEAGIQLQAEEFDFMAAAGDLDEIEEVNANCILMANLQHASTSGTQHDRAPVYDTDDSAEVHLNDNCYDNEIFNIFTQEEQYTDILEPIPKPQLVPQNDNHVTYVAPSMVHSG